MSMMLAAPAGWKLEQPQMIQPRWKRQMFPKQTRLSDRSQLFILRLIVFSPCRAPSCAACVGATALCTVISVALQQGSSRAAARVCCCCCSRARKIEKTEDWEKCSFFFQRTRNKESNCHKAALCFNYAECLSRGAYGCHILESHL